MRSVGARVKILWEKDEVQTSGQRVGRYVGTVKEYISDADTVVVEFDTEEGAFYNYLLQKNVVAGKVKLARSIERTLNSYEERCMIGSIVEVKWTEDDLKGTEWSVGWYEAEV